MKPRATIDRQIDTLRGHGVTFSLRGEADARRFLARNTYFFKLKSYEHNYDKAYQNNAYVYVGLDFEYLVELSLIDFSLSRLTWIMCSNIEHAVKVNLNAMLMSHPDPRIGEKCLDKCFSDELPRKYDNPYTNDLQAKCNEGFQIWYLWELGSFQQQLDVYNKCYEMVKGVANPWRHILFVVRKMRNAVSHGNCLLTDLHRPTPSRRTSNHGDLEITRKAMEMCGRMPKQGTRTSALQKSLDSLVVNNFAAVLLCHLNFVNSIGTLRHCQQEVKTFIGRVERHRQDYFGDKGAPSPRNQLVNQTLNTLVTLANGYLMKSEEKVMDTISSDDLV